MSLTAAQETEVYKWLGATPMWRQVDPSIRNALLSLTTFADVNLEALIAAELTALNDIDAKMVTAANRLKFKRVEDVEFNVGGEIVELRAQGRMHVQRLARLLGVTVRADVFSGGGALGGVMKHG